MTASGGVVRHAMTSTISRCVVLVSVLFPSLAFSQNAYVIRPELSSSSVGDPYNLGRQTRERPKVGIVLSGGGARGIAHIGVLKALEKHHVPIDFIAGNSMGAIVGGLYAAGYSVAELESIALHTNWDDILALTEDTRRSELYLDQKQAQEQSFLLIRFDGLTPIIPSSLSSGQRLTNFLTTLTMQALYHPNPDFDDLKIPFRAVATDLISGKRVVLDRGSLAEALRATVSVPLLFSPLKRDSMSLVDGGLITNAPVDLAKQWGCDVIISSNTTSGMRSPNQLNAPWETADQIMSIMMQSSNEKQFGMANVVLTPNLANHLSSEFSGLDSLIQFGEEETERHIDTIRTLVSHKNMLAAIRDTSMRHHVFRKSARVFYPRDDFPEELKNAIAERAAHNRLTTEQIANDLHDAYATGDYANIQVAIGEDHGSPTLTYYANRNPVLREVVFRGNTRVPDSTIVEKFRTALNKPLNFLEVRSCVEQVIRLYRDRDYSLARVDSLRFDERSGVLAFAINEGIIRRVEVRGNTYTEDYVIRREFPQQDGELFNIRKARLGVVNINGTGLFEYVLLDVRYEGDRPIVIVKVQEKSSNNIRLGIHADNERSFQGLIDVRDANLFGSGQELGFGFATSLRSRLYRLEYRANRIFNTILTFNLRGEYRFDDVYTYDNGPSTTDTRFERTSVGEYRQVKQGGTLAFGAQLERLGTLFTEFRLENQEIKALSGIGYSPERYKLVTLKIGTTFDTENRFPFPTSGIKLTVSYESAMRQLGSELSFGKLFMTYENYVALSQNHSLLPRITVGIADATLPLAEQFSLGGMNSFFGLREYDSRGRQLFLVNTEYRYRLPFKVVFDSYLKFRYDLGMISRLPEEIQLVKFHHGVGVELALDTPIGPASFGMGKSFFIRRELRNNPVSTGPFLFYFSIGYGL